jgi:hypothetical protein
MNHLFYLKKTHLDSFGSFKGLSLHRDRQREATLFYTKMMISVAILPWQTSVQIVLFELLILETKSTLSAFTGLSN